MLEALGPLTASREWAALHNAWLVTRDKWDLEDQLAAAEKRVPDRSSLIAAFAPILAYAPRTALEWAEKASVADYRGHMVGHGIATVLWADAARIGIHAADRRTMSKGGAAARVVSAYHSREGVRSQYGAHPEGSDEEAAVLRVWDETTKIILGARSTAPAITFTQLRLIMDVEVSPIEGDESTRSALVPLLAAAAAQYLDQT